MGHSKYIKITGKEEEVSNIVGQYSDLITSTMGPGGCVTLVQVGTGAMATKDGVTVSNHIAPKDSFHSLLSRLIIDAADRTVKEVGDGTTTTVCLLSAFYKLWHTSYAIDCKNRRSFLRGMDAAALGVIDFLLLYSKKLDDENGINYERLRDVAIIACNGNEEIGEMISNLVCDIGTNGRVMIKRNIGTSTYTEKERGYTFDTVMLGRQHMRDRSKAEQVLMNPLFIMNADGFENDTEIVPVIDTWLRSEELKEPDGALRPLVIVTTGLIGSARSFISANADRYPIYVVSPPMAGEEGWEIMTDLQDITSTYQVYLKTAGKAISMAFGVDFEPEDEMELPQTWKEFGSAAKCIVSAEKCSIMPYDDYDPQVRVDILQRRIDDSKDEREIAFLRQRIAALTSGVGVIYVGADSDAEAYKLEHAIDDAQRACFTALKGGVVPGAGRAFMFAAKYMWDSLKVEENALFSDYWAGYALVLDALKIPALQILSNFNDQTLIESNEKLDNLANCNPTFGSDFWAGWDISGDEMVKDMYRMGVIDPVLVCRSSLKNAISVAKQLIHCKYVLVEDSMLPTSDGQPVDYVDERVSVDQVKELYRRLDLLKANKEGTKWEG